MMRNIATGNISPQFHVVFDDKFETVSTDFQDPSKSLDIAFSSDQWRTLLQTTDKFFPDDAHPPPLSHEWDNPDNPDNNTIRARQHRRRNFQRLHPLDSTAIESTSHRERERMNNMSLLKYYTMEMFLLTHHMIY